MNEQQQPSLAFLDLVWNYKFSLAGYIVAISFLTLIILYAIGGVPDELKVISEPTAPLLAMQNISNSQVFLQKKTSSSVMAGQGILPVHIIIAKIGVDASITNPTSTNNDTLNNFLLRGAVRYPGSGTLGQGNMFIFGHSTGIRIVNNQAYKTFNHLNYLKVGDTIVVESNTAKYTYSVSSVKLVDSDASLVNLSTNKNMLTLSTCDVFGEKQQRYVVEAEYVGVSAL